MYAGIFRLTVRYDDIVDALCAHDTLQGGFSSGLRMQPYSPSATPVGTKLLRALIGMGKGLIGE